MDCPKCHSSMKRARLDVWWCKYCQTSWLIHKLPSYKSFEEASRVVTKEEVWNRFMKDKFMIPPRL